MSNGGKVESRQGGGNALDNRASSHEFGSAISRIAVAQICQSVGFESSTEAAMNSFSEVIAKYISDLGKTATSYASLSGRSQCNVFDVIHGLEDFCPHTGLMGASEANICGVNSGVMKEIVEYVEASEEIPFAQPVSRFPVIKIPKMIPTFDQIGENPESKHIPRWLPAFPDPHTYVHTDTWNERVSDPRDDKIELARQRRKAERSLLNLQQRLVCNGLPVPSSSHKLRQIPGSKLTLNDEESENPFLARTLQAGDKDASSIALPAKFFANDHHTSLLQTFSPAIEAIKDSISEMGNGTEKKHVTYKRLPALCLELKPGKKVLGDSLDVRLWNNGSSGRGASWFRKDDDNKDDKKRRAELILRQSIENQQELMQL
ncbi:unnamed protein product [Cuscuta epithymum]|uniref:Transcription initiation factor TFIID subunit 8 n=1 Tax=Cuscuta epithymum TaxID=186058 RepID=A0AAV0CV72_9ASTE|nr:unnamed protein product [Cuscuta epithymum]